MNINSANRPLATMVMVPLKFAPVPAAAPVPGPKAPLRVPIVPKMRSAPSVSSAVPMRPSPSKSPHVPGATSVVPGTGLSQLPSTNTGWLAATFTLLTYAIPPSKAAAVRQKTRIRPLVADFFLKPLIESSLTYGAEKPGAPPFPGHGGAQSCAAQIFEDVSIIVEKPVWEPCVPDAPRQ